MQILPGQEGRIFDLAFSPDGRWLASCGVKGITLWETDTRVGTVAFRRSEPLGATARVAFAGEHLVVRAQELGMWLLNVTTMQLVPWPMPPGPTATPPGLAILPKGDLVVTSAWIPHDLTHVIRQFSSRTWQNVRDLYRIRGFHSFAGMAFDPTGRWLATSPALLDVQTGAIRRDFQVLSGNIQWSPRDPIVASALVGDPLWITD